MTPPTCIRSIHADVVALEQVFTYNRFGSFNPVGMMYALKKDVIPISGSQPGPGNASLRHDKRPRPLVLRVNVGDCLDVTVTNWLSPTRPKSDAPFTRHISFHVNGLVPRDLQSDGSWVGKNPSSLLAPGDTMTYHLYASREGTYLIQDLGAPAGGEGDGGSLSLGLFGAVNVEPKGSVWYRSQVSARDLTLSTSGLNPDGTPRIQWDARDPATQAPLLEILDGTEIVHGDLNAIITGYPATEFNSAVTLDEGHFREFTVIFHDELKTVHAFPELDDSPILHGVRDAFGINYGSSGMGSIILANRKKIGPTADCIECKFEEFFLTSWANGDPALLVEHDSSGVAIRAPYEEDPSNVHHSYLGDPVRIRNLHAGPAETHVFHLHAHQWLKNPASDNSVYLDSQSISPGAAFTYDVTYGGGGNRNLTPGDAIFHCHLYPHFAQGMWGLWRVHDTLEKGTPDRNLPDGEIAQGTPTPALVPIPDLPMPPLPTYAPSLVRLSDGSTVVRPPMPGYPHYMAAKAGRRPPQPPLDIIHDGGLPRHLVDVVHEVVPPDDDLQAPEIFAADLLELPLAGTAEERAAMDFHAGKFPHASPSESIYGFPTSSYPSFTANGTPGGFQVNGLLAKAGAPFADPCPPGAPLRTFRVSYLQIDMITNAQGWHDPQARIIVLDEDVQPTLSGQRPPEPFFFRAHSGDCIHFEATNHIPAFLEEDDYQIRIATDTMGQHIHLVKFDVTSSDGAANGWNYEDGTFSSEEVLARIAAANVVGGMVKADGSRRVLSPI